jgi:hypothetical protein
MDQLDPNGASRFRGGEWTVAGDERSVERLCEDDVHGVVGADVVSQLPGAMQEIDMGMTVQIQVREISNGFLRTIRRDFANPHEASEALNDFDVQQMRHMEFVPMAKEAAFHAHANRGLQEKLQYRRRIDDDHADSRSWRMIAAARVFSVTCFRPWSLASMSSRVGRAASRSSSTKR